MRLLLDEDVPRQVVDVLRHLLPTHELVHIHELNWAGKKDIFVLRDAVGRYDALVTNNYRQLDDPVETTQIKKSGLHHVSYRQRVGGLRGLGLAIGAIVAAMPGVVEDLTVAEGQRLVQITDLDPSRRYKIIDPRRDPPRYWPR